MPKRHERQGPTEEAVMVDAAPVVLIGVDADGRVTSWNLAATEVLGTAAAHMLGRALPAGLATEVRRLRGIAHPGDPPVHGEANVGHANGSELYVAVDLRLGLNGIATVALHDITSLHAERHELQRDRGSFRTLLEHLPVMTYQEQVRGSGYPSASFLYLSPQIKDLLGYDQEEITADIDMYWRKIMHPDDREAVIREAERTIAKGDLYEQEYRLIARDGRVVWIYDVARLVEVDAEGNQIWDGVNVDITERHRVEDALARSEERYRTLVDQAPAITYLERVTGSRYPEDVEVFTSPQVRDILGYEPATWEPGETSFWITAIHPEDRARVLGEAGRCISVGKPYLLEYRMLHADGSTIWLRDETRYAGTQDGAQMWQGIAVDITDRKAVEERLRDTIAMLEQTDLHRRKLMGDLVQAQELERKRIAADIHDDTIQAMVAVSLRLDLLHRQMRGRDDSGDLEVVRDTVESAVARLRGLLFDLRPRILDEQGLRPAIRMVARSLQQGREVDIDVDIDLVPEPDSDVRVVAFRIVKEALENACRHASASRIDVRAWWEGATLHLRVHDDGRGFDPLVAERAPGHLGIVTMRERAEVLGGGVTLTTGPGAGTTVEVHLPAIPGSYSLGHR